MSIKVIKRARRIIQTFRARLKSSYKGIRKIERRKNKLKNKRNKFHRFKKDKIGYL